MAVDREGLQARLRALFVDELADNVAVLSRGLVALEQQDGALPGGEVVHELFRAAHSLKGGAHSAGVGELVKLCHHLEDALSRLRDGTLPSTTGVVESLLVAVDALAAAGRRLRNGGEAAGADVQGAERRLTALVEGHPDAATDSPARDDPAPEGTAARPAAAVPAGGVPAAGVAAAAPTVEPAGSRVAHRDSSVRVRADRLDTMLNQAGELIRACGRLDALADELAEVTSVAAELARSGALSGPAVRGHTTRSAHDAQAWRAMADRLDELTREAVDADRVLTGLGRSVADTVRHARMMPLSHGYEGLDHVVRDLARAGSKDVRLEVSGGDLEIDRPILEALADAVLHLVRNAVDHGIEPPDERTAAGKPPSGHVRIDADLVPEGVAVSVTDDGRGIDADALRASAQRRGISTPDDDALVTSLAFLPGVSTSSFLTEFSGRGVGLDAVRARIEAIGGTANLHSTPGAGSTVTLTLPLALSAVRVLLVNAAGEVLGVPSASVDRLLRIDAGDVRLIGDRDAVLLEGRPVPVLRLSDVLGFPAVPVSAPFTAVHTRTPTSEALLLVDELLSEEEVVMKPLGEGPAAVPGVLGATIMSSGRVALVLNLATWVRTGMAGSAPVPVLEAAGPGQPARRARVLLAEDTITTRALERSILEAAGYDVLVAVDGVEAWQLLDEHGADIVVSDVDMPRMDGITLCETARRSSRFRDLPFILVTSLATEADRRRGVDAGASAYLVKADFDQELLLDTIERLL